MDCGPVPWRHVCGAERELVQCLAMQMGVGAFFIYFMPALRGRGGVLVTKGGGGVLSSELVKGGGGNLS